MLVVLIVMIVIVVQEAVLGVIVIAILVMMYIVGAIGLLLIAAVAELELNYLNNIANYKLRRNHCTNDSCRKNNSEQNMDYMGQNKNQLYKGIYLHKIHKL